MPAPVTRCSTGTFEMCEDNPASLLGDTLAYIRTSPLCIKWRFHWQKNRISIKRQTADTRDQCSAFNTNARISVSELNRYTTRIFVHRLLFSFTVCKEYVGFCVRVSQQEWVGPHVDTRRSKSTILLTSCTVFPRPTDSQYRLECTEVRVTTLTAEA